jgi:hypothetical protein
MTPEEYESLKQQIKEAKENNHPLFEQKIVVRKVSEESFELIDGEHKLRACRELGILEIPKELIEILEIDEKESLLKLGRMKTRGSDIDPFRQAAWIEALHNTGDTYEQIGKELGLSKSRMIHIAQRLEIPQTIRARLEGASTHLVDEISSLHKMEAFEKVTEWSLAFPRTQKELREYIHSDEIQKLDVTLDKDKREFLFRIENNTFLALKEWTKDSVLPHTVEITVQLPEHEHGISERRAMDIMVNILLKEVLKKEKYI